jgi:amino acid permease
MSKKRVSRLPNETRSERLKYFFANFLRSFLPLLVFFSFPLESKNWSACQPTKEWLTDRDTRTHTKKDQQKQTKYENKQRKKETTKCRIIESCDILN